MTKTRKFLTALLALSVAVAFLPAAAFADEAPGTLEFKANNKIYDAHGKFENWQLTRVTIPDGDLEKGVVEFEVQLSSVWEKAEALAEHLRQADFFDVEKFATASVKIDRVKKTGDKSYSATATVDFHGHTGEVPVTFDVVSESPLKIEGKGVMKRTAFGLGGAYDSSNDRSIVEDVQVMLSATLQK